MPAKSVGLQVKTGSPCAIAVAAIIASYARAAGLRPRCRSDAATRPNARAAAASNGIGSKSVSACCTCAWRAARSRSSRATSGPADNSASVTAVISGSAGSSPGSRSHATHWGRYRLTAAPQTYTQLELDEVLARLNARAMDAPALDPLYPQDPSDEDPEPPVNVDLELEVRRASWEQRYGNGGLRRPTRPGRRH